jgi:hypothetical protein
MLGTTDLWVLAWRGISYIYRQWSITAASPPRGLLAYLKNKLR